MSMHTSAKPIPQYSMGVRSWLSAGHSISWMSSSRKTVLVMRATWALALLCMSKNLGPTLYAATNTYCSSICTIYPAAVKFPRTTKRSVRPSTLISPVWHVPYTTASPYTFISITLRQKKSGLVCEQHRSPLAKLPVDVATCKQKANCAKLLR
jgi:hypothetical protein